MIQHQPILRAVNLEKAFGGQIVLDGVTVELYPGEVVLLQGPNGSGKTTLINILTGNLPADAGALELFGGRRPIRVVFPRPWWTRLNPIDPFAPNQFARAGVGRSWQDIRLFATQNLLDNVAVATPRQMGVNPLCSLFARWLVNRREKSNLDAARIRLGQVGLTGREHSTASRISLGQAKRVALARAVQGGAKILFLDEPLAGLDGQGTTQMVEHLSLLAREHRVTLVIVEHDFHLPKLRDLATTVWSLADGRLTMQSAEETLPPSAAERWKSWLAPLTTDRELIEETLPGGCRLYRFPLPGFATQTPVLEVERLIVRRGCRMVAGGESGASFSLSDHELAVLEAPNGWGKTSLFEALAGISPATGIIRLNGRSIVGSPAWHRRKRGISVLGARGNSFPSLTVAESLRVAGRDEVPRELRPHAARRVADLSGGERQRVAIFAAFTGNSVVTLLDEPFLALDQPGTELLARLVSTAPGAKLIAVPGLSSSS